MLVTAGRLKFLAVTLCAATAVITMTQATTEDALMNQITDVCKEAVYFKMAANKLATELKQLTDGDGNLGQLSRLWALTAARSRDPPTKGFYKSLSLYAASKARTNAMAKPAAAQAYSEALMRAAEHTGYLTGLEHSAEALKTATVAQSGSASGTTCVQDLTISYKSFTSCPHKTPAAAGLTAIEINPFTTEKLKISDHTSIAALTKGIKLTTTVTGDSYTSVATGTCTMSGSSGSATKLTIAQSIAKTTAATATDIREAKDGQKQCKQQPGSDSDSNPKQRLESAICQAQEQQRLLQRQATTVTAAELESDPTMLRLVNNLVMGDQRVDDPTGEKGKETVVARIKALIGEAANFNKNFIEEPKQTRVAFGEKDKGEQTLGDLARGSDYALALSYFESQHVLSTETAMKQECKPQVTETEDSCNKKGQTECKSPCKWNPEAGGTKKCKLDSKAKEAVEKAAAIEEGKDGKTTNTTASNTFVIHKAPLWLAVLLF
uniref:Variant surface glycoprotein n=1 Tax=Trypanosoma brucei TaxID=5691 RepID=A0A1V0FY12_9TRYP|nr:variant surface glycoprotein [Trypanosoma brucei]